jgi:Ca2+-binding EF-hand superfamily protein
MSRIHRIPRCPRWLAAAAVALAALLLPSVAAAQKAPPQDASPQALFVRIDSNSDGRVSKNEAARMPGVATRWEELDRNKDGALSREEFVAGFRT